MAALIRSCSLRLPPRKYRPTMSSAPISITAPQAPSFYGLTRDALRESLERRGEPHYRASQLFSWIYRRHQRDPAAMTDLPAALRRELPEWFGLALPATASVHASPDGLTHKFVLALADGARVECVSMRTERRLTLCLSSQVGCALCHAPSLRTGASVSRALRNKAVNLFSDLIVHRMGPGLADQLSFGKAGPDEFRSAPLWGVGQRIFLMHDGRTRDLLEAISAHQSDGDGHFPASEANAVVDAFNALTEEQKQSVLDFLRAL